MNAECLRRKNNFPKFFVKGIYFHIKKAEKFPFALEGNSLEINKFFFFVCAMVLHQKKKEKGLPFFAPRN
jgi:hypothetical protein